MKADPPEPVSGGAERPVQRDVPTDPVDGPDRDAAWPRELSGDPQRAGGEDDPDRRVRQRELDREYVSGVVSAVAKWPA